MDANEYGCRSNMKILHISPKYFARGEMGGGERYSLELCKALSRYVDTTLLVFGDERKTIQMNDLCIEVYPEWRIARSLGVNPFSTSFPRDLRGADLIHIHQFRTTLSNVSILYGKLNGKPIFVTDHGGRNFLGWGFSFLLGRLVSSFLAVSEFSAKDFLRYSSARKRPVRVIFGGVDVSKFYPRNIEKKERKVLFVGRITPHKGCEYLVKAVQDFDDVELHLIGTPLNLKVISFLKAMDKKGKVRFRFCISDEDLANEYSSSIVTVLPSVYKDYYGKFHPIPELLGLTLLESMACGTPVICTRAGGMIEIVKNGESGFIVNPNDPDGLREKIEYFINNLEEAKDMGRRGRDIVSKKYTWDAVARRCLIAYNEFLH